MDKKNVLDIEGMMSSVADAGLDPSILETKLNLPKASSIIEWVEGENFRNAGWFARQAEQAVRLFADYCPECTDLDYLDNVPVSDPMVRFKERVAVLEHGVCPRCHKDRKKSFTAWWEGIGKDKFPDYANYDYLPPFELVGCLGQRAGKSTMVGGFFSTYIVHRHLCLQDPISYYGVAPDSPFQVSFVATRVENAQKNLWPNFHGAIRNAPWFKLFAQEVRAEEKKLGLKAETLFRIRDTAIHIPIKYLSASCVAAAEGAIRGATRIVAAVDEIAFMEMNPDAKVVNANKTYTALSNSLRTVRSAADTRWRENDYNPIPAIMLNISSPAHKHDKIMSLLADSKKTPRVVGFHFATWEINPKVSREDLRDEELRDPAEFALNFGAIPPLAQDPYLAKTEAVAQTQCAREPNIIVDTVYKDIGPDKLVAGALRYAKGNISQPHILALDAGHTNNSFALGLYHVEQEGDGYVVYTDGLFSAIPERMNGMDIKTHFPAMADLVLEIHKNYNLKCVLYDQWQSISDIQRLRAAGVNALSYSPVWADFEATKNLIYSGKFKTPQWEKPITELDPKDVYDRRKNVYTHFGYQMATVKVAGKKVTKPDVGDDDMWRTLVLAVSKFRLDFPSYVVSLGPTGAVHKPTGASRNVGVMIGRSGTRSSLSLSGSSSTGIVGAVRKRTGR